MTQITQGRVKLAEYARNTWIAVAPHGVSPSEAMKPEFWAHVAMSIRAWDRIELRCEDDSWFADLIVFKASRVEVHARALMVIDSDGNRLSVEPSAPIQKDAKPDLGIPPGYSVDYGGPIHKHRVIRSADSEILVHGLSKKEAIQWAIDHAAGKTTVGAAA